MGSGTSSAICNARSQAPGSGQRWLYWGYTGIMENRRETTIGIIGYIFGLYWDNGK